MSLEATLQAIIKGSQRGIQSRIAENTELTKTEISNWMAGRRPIPAHKLIQAIDYLIDEGVLVVEVHISHVQ